MPHSSRGIDNDLDFLEFIEPMSKVILANIFNMPCIEFRQTNAKGIIGSRYHRPLLDNIHTGHLPATKYRLRLSSIVLSWTRANERWDYRQLAV